MKIEQLKCPSCGAPLQVPSESDHLTCSSCGTLSVVERSESHTVLRLADQVRQAIREARLEVASADPPAPVTGRRLPGWAIIMGVAVILIGGLLTLMLIKPPQKSLCDEPAPEWSLTLFPDYRGDWPSPDLNLSDLRGKGVVLNFWASWCKPCEEEAAALEAAWRQYGAQGIVFVGIDYLDQDPAAKRYLQKFDVTYPNGPDLASKISKRYTIRGVPETFFINPKGEIVGCRKIGPLSQQELEARIAEIMPK